MLVNGLSGRTKEFKKVVSLQELQNVEDKFLNFYGRNELIADFYIPELYLNAFAQNACTDSAVLSALENKNKNMLRFLLIEISREFLEDYKIKTLN